MAIIYALAFDRRNARRWIAFAVTLRVAWFGMLRPGEVFALSAATVDRPSVIQHYYVMVLTLLNAKNRNFFGRLQVSLVRDEETVSWAVWFFEGAPADAKLWQYGRQTFVRMMDKVAAALRLHRAGYTPGSLRPGRASDLFESGVSVARIKVLGRWCTERAMGAYLQEAEAAVSLLRLPQRTLGRLEAIHSAFGFLLLPPDWPLNRLDRA